MSVVNRLFLCACLSLCAGLSQHLDAAVRMPEILSDGMVLQRSRPVPIWGQADPAEKVTVTFADQKKQAVADAGGKWKVLLDPMEASFDGRDLVISGENTIALHNILVGEVWVCSGQSNMDFELKKSVGGPDAIAHSNDPHLRWYFLSRKFRKPEEPTGARWRESSPDTVPNVTGVGYFFARDLRAALKVPVAIIHSSWGGTQAESWTPREYLIADPDLKMCVDRDEIWAKERPAAKIEFDAKTAAWKKEAEQAKAEGKKAPDAPRAPDCLRQDRPAGTMYRIMLEPILGYGARGVLWYQGESNSDRAWQYRKLLPTMIQAWRDRWPDQDLWFGIVQLPNFHKQTDTPTDGGWSHLRDAQLATSRSVRHTGLIVTIDVGDGDDVHPTQKEPVGKRASQWALADVYGQNITRGGPAYRSMEIHGSEIVLTFADTGAGLKVRDEGALQEFWIAGADKKWTIAQARISGPNTVTVRADSVADPKAVRYSWADNPKHPNLTNDTDIPAAPFRTDDWPGPSDGKR